MTTVSGEEWVGEYHDPYAFIEEINYNKELFEFIKSRVDPNAKPVPKRFRPVTNSPFRQFYIDKQKASVIICPALEVSRILYRNWKAFTSRSVPEASKNCTPSNSKSRIYPEIKQYNRLYPGQRQDPIQRSIFSHRLRKPVAKSRSSRRR